MEVKPAISFCKALEDKYSLDKLDDTFENISIAPHRRTLILKQHNHSERTILALDGCNINEPGEEGDIESTCPNIKELDISCNRITKIPHIIKITSQLKNLTFLNLSHNVLHDNVIPKDHAFQCQPSLKKLILTKTQVSFESLLHLLKIYPSVHELHASLNNLHTVPPNYHDQFENVEVLHFANNNIRSWEEIEKLGEIFTNVKSLFIGENPIEIITTTHDKASLLYPKLEKLVLTKTLLKKWSCLEKLNAFPLLVNVRFCDIPLFAKCKNEKERHNLIMVRLPKLKYINGSKVNETEREDAERMLLRRYENKKNKPACYERLFKIHGILDELADVKLDKIEYVHLTLKGDIDKTQLLKLDVSITCFDLKKYVSEIIKIPAKDFRLLAVHTNKQINPYYDNGVVQGKAIRLRSFYLEDGDFLEIQRKDMDHL